MIDSVPAGVVAPGREITNGLPFARVVGCEAASGWLFGEEREKHRIAVVMVGHWRIIR